MNYTYNRIFFAKIYDLKLIFFSLAEYYRENAKRVYEEIGGEKGVDKKKFKEEQKKRAIEFHKEGKSLREITQIVLGDENLKSIIHRWVS